MRKVVWVNGTDIDINMIILTSLKFINIARHWNHMLLISLQIYLELFQQPLKNLYIPISPCILFCATYTYF